MDIQYITQPEEQFGRVIQRLLESEPLPTKVILVSAFASKVTLMRFRSALANVKAAGGDVRVIVGFDLQGTSLEALREILGWEVDARVFKNLNSSHTFHPKIYLIERARAAHVITGSNNLTEGGFYNNYEVALRVDYSLPEDLDKYSQAQASLAALLDPRGTTVQRLTSALIDQLLVRGDICSEILLREKRRKTLAGRSSSRGKGVSPFGGISMCGPPPLPAQLVSELSIAVARERQGRQARVTGGRRAGVVRPSLQLFPFAFYMELNKLQGTTIPGEARVPMEARDLAESFWGWPDRYTREARKRGKTARWYWNYKPFWRIRMADKPESVHSEEVRMYEYEASSDFRFYSSGLVAMGADEGDIVKIIRLDGARAEFECVLAKKGTDVHKEWSGFCNRRIRNSNRKYGYS